MQSFNKEKFGAIFASSRVEKKTREPMLFFHVKELLGLKNLDF